MNDRTRTLTVTIPTDEEAIAALGNLIQHRSGWSAENQLCVRLWLTDVLQKAGVIAPDEALPEPEPVEGELVN